MGPGKADRGAVFLDRDNTLMFDVPYASRPEQVRLMPGVGAAIRELNRLGFATVVITNQSGIARGYFTEEQLGEVNEELRVQLAKWGATIDALYYCPHLPDEGCPCRKPGIQLFQRACEDHGIDPKASFVVGDQAHDVEAGLRMGCKTALIRNDMGLGEIAKDGFRPTIVCANLSEFVDWLRDQQEPEWSTRTKG